MIKPRTEVLPSSRFDVLPLPFRIILAILHRRASLRGRRRPPRTQRGPFPSPFVFPVVGPYRYTNDFGDPRPQGTHEGNDVLAPKNSIVVAAEDGKIKFWTTSARAGCMLYLYGASGTTYLYIHLNNDVTMANDNRGKCVAGGSYWPGLKDGAQVVAGPGDRLRRRLRRRRRHAPPPLRGAPERRRADQPVPVPEQGDAAALRGAARQRGHAGAEGHGARSSSATS